MTEVERDHSVLSRLVGRWHGTLLHRTDADRPFTQLPGTSENRWLLGGRFVEMTVRAGASGDTWSAVFYIGYEHSDRRHVLVSVEPDDRRITTRIGEWMIDQDRLVLPSHQSRAVCDTTIPGHLRLELAEDVGTSREFVRFTADFRTAGPHTVKPPLSREHRRFVIA
jgi:hypothetical protein